LIHFLHSRLDTMTVEHLFRSVSAYARSHPERKQWKELPELLRGMVSSVWKREARTGAGSFAVPCDAWDDYITTLLHGCDGYMGGDAVDGYGGDGDWVAVILFHIHFARDVPNVVAQMTRTMQDDTRLLEQLQQARAQAPIPPRPERKPLPERTDYFPTGVLGQEDAFTTSWYGAMLQSLEEPSLWQQSQADPGLHAYRFLWLRTFDAPIAVRLTLGQDAGHELVWKVADGAGGYEGGDLDVEESRSVTDEEAEAFLSLLERSGFWRLPSVGEQMGLDGARWILEGIQNGRYHLVDRWSPDENEEDAFRDAALTLVRLTDLSLDSTDIY
jgi:hypothetical protein